ncbi:MULTISPECIES: hypothetical protein [unclassified Borrelia]|uniref:hypothetical protein n=1 Tax=unclassified Borrelia TaxID=2649934 RepID=UPI001E422B04|nr:MULTISPECIES: hypothetical protein [unclassified Borrelia]UGQ16011.1 hypothetical protein LSO06_01640 [Borrelia sp. RT5S]UGQ17124.1 hypothetical protein LSO05_01640 [Borrelia sp. RT1S]
MMERNKLLFLVLSLLALSLFSCETVYNVYTCETPQEYSGASRISGPVGERR